MATVWDTRFTLLFVLLVITGAGIVANLVLVVAAGTSCPP